ncbi:Na+-driven multidrug efflux pump [Arenibacter nanhaiticus]|uniref:Na+-driven multidrug efflux pump n=1 Tax=Arenibacter nanhaiticus TaxID=558155 RepID=A0A1M6LY12_9FLAO|nr:MATE family efflux transporter [Arenibacter nanhaiticus]SHJ76157.1 Na+-driven multidrug efflux pump [Arenibacter nanhaiticus]
MSFKFIQTQAKRLFSSENERSHKAKKNVINSLCTKAIGMLIMYLMVPLSISYLGVENYGVWIVISGIVSWAGMFDLGLAHGLRNYLAVALAEGNISEGRSFVSTTYFMILSVSLLILIIGSLFIYNVNLQGILNVYSVSESNLKNISFIILLFFLLQFSLKPINAILQAYQIPSYTQIIGVVGSIISICGIFISLNFFNKTPLYTYAVIVSLAPVISILLGSIYLFQNKFYLVKPKISKIKIISLRKIGGLGVDFFVIQLCLLVVYTSDNLIISHLFGPSEVTAYSIPYKYFSLLTILFTVIMSPYWSAITEAYVKKDFDWIKKTIKNLSFIILGGLIITLIMVLISDIIYKLWIGNQVLVSRNLTILMGVYSMLMAVQTLFSSFSNGIGKIKIQMYTYIFCAIINLPLSLYFGKVLNLGGFGVLLATVSCLTIVSIVLIIQYHKIINKTAKGLWLR